MFHDIATQSIDKHLHLPPFEKSKYTNKIWHFVKYTVFFFANLVTAAPEGSPISPAVLNQFMSTNIIVNFLTEVTEHEAKEVANFSKVAVSRGE